MELETKRLVLRPFQQGDLPHLIAYATKPQFYKYLGLENQTEDTLRTFLKERLDDQKKSARTRHRHTFAMALQETNRLIGSIRIEIQDNETGRADIGYAMDLSFEGRGYMTEAMHCVLQYGFHDLGANEIWAMMLKKNIRSWKLAERIGMQRVANPPPENVPISSDYKDQYNYVIIANS